MKLGGCLVSCLLYYVEGGEGGVSLDREAETSSPKPV